MKIAFFGTPPFTVSFLKHLQDSGYIPSLVVTGPDVPVGRKQMIQSPAPKLWADQMNIPCLQPEKITADFIDKLKKENFDLFVVVAYGKILPEELITLPKLGTINVHYSLLPKYRGATPVESAILAGDTETGVCIQKMVYELDAGDIIEQQVLTIDDSDTHIELREKLNTMSYPLLTKSIERLKNGETVFIPQDHTQKTVCKKIKKEHGLVNLDEAGEILWRKYKAYFGWPGIFFYTQKNERTLRIKIASAHFTNHKFEIDTVIPEGKNEMKYTDFLLWK